jgi:predicted DCC family thiol-disulfide oxidoreductase YuxK
MRLRLRDEPMSIAAIPTPSEGSGPPVFPERWRLLYDGECGFCKWMLAAILGWDRRRRLLPVALQSNQAGALLGDLDPGERLASWHLVSPEGERTSAGAALAPLLRLLPGGGVPARSLSLLPRLTDRAYGWVASHRVQLSRAVPRTLKRRAGERVLRAEAKRAEGF